VAIPAKTRYEWDLHCAYCGDREVSAVEVRPKAGGLMNWRFAVPTSVEIVSWGCGPPGNQEHSPAKRAPVGERQAAIGDTEVIYFGAGDRLSQGVAAYVVFKGAPPEFVAFGSEPVGDKQGAFMMERVTFVSLLDKALEDARAAAVGPSPAETGEAAGGECPSADEGAPGDNPGVDEGEPGIPGGAHPARAAGSSA
jgi:hypothetical protein